MRSCRRTRPSRPCVDTPHTWTARRPWRSNMLWIGIVLFAAPSVERGAVQKAILGGNGQQLRKSQALVQTGVVSGAYVSRALCSSVTRSARRFGASFRHIRNRCEQPTDVLDHIVRFYDPTRRYSPLGQGCREVGVDRSSPCLPNLAQATPRKKAGAFTLASAALLSHSCDAIRETKSGLQRA